MTSDLDTTVRPVEESPPSEPVVAVAARPKPALYDIPVAPSRLGLVGILSGAGLVVVGIADAMARNGHETAVVPLFAVGLLGVFLPCAWRLVGRTAARSERMTVSVMLGVGLLLAFYMRSPLIFDGFDELLHGTTLHALVTGRTLVVHNTSVPVSPYYPGLELVTVAVKWMTGLPLVLAQLLVLLAVRVVLVLGIFLVVERVCRSSVAGGIGVVVFAANPQFYAFDSQYSYETLALALAVAAVWFLLSAVDADAAVTATSGDRARQTRRERRGAVIGHRDLLLAVACVVALVFTHHLTAWLTSAFFVVWYLAWRRGARRHEARLVGVVAATAVVLCAAWTAFVGGHLLAYLGPIFRAAVAGLGSAIGQLRSERQLFHTPTGQGGATTWEIAAMLDAAALWCLILAAVGYDMLRRRSQRRGWLPWIPLVVAVGYPVALATSLSSNSSEVGQRAITFVFFGMAMCVGAWVARLITSPAPGVQREVMGVAAGLCFLGSVLFGSGPAATLLPGPYKVGADSLSFGAPSTALAQWASVHLPAGSNVAADRDNGVLLADMAHVDVVTAIGGLVNPGPIFFDRRLSTFDRRLIRQAHIHYIVTDLRLASAPPLFGTYIEPGESKPGVRLTLPELTKFEAIPGVQRIYDNGAIQVYDLSVLNGRPAAAVPAGANTGTASDAGNIRVLVVAGVVGVLILRPRLRRGRQRDRPTETGLLTGLVTLLVFAMAFGAAMVPSGIPPIVAGLVGLVALAMWALVVSERKRRLPAHRGEPKGDLAVGARPRLATGLAGGIALAGVGLAIAATAAAPQWRSPPALSFVSASHTATVVDVNLGDSAASGTVTATYFGGPTVSQVVSGSASEVPVVLPPHSGAAEVRLTSGGQTRSLFLW